MPGLSVKAIKHCCVSALHQVLPALLPNYLQRWACCVEKPPEKLYATSCLCLDGLRGIAALFVFFFHTIWTYRNFVEFGYGAGPENNLVIQLPFIRLFYAGHAMVAVFFVVGGYVISLKPLKQMRSYAWEDLHLTLVSSLFRRGLRIYIPAIVATFMTMLTVYCGLWEYPRQYVNDRRYVNYADIHPAPADTFHAQFHDWFTSTMGMTNLWRYYNDGFLQPYYNPYDPHLWTVAYEMRSSIIVMLTLITLSRCREITRLSLVIAMIVFCGYWDRWECMLFLSGTLLAEIDLIYRSGLDTSYTLNLPGHVSRLSQTISTNPRFTFPGRLGEKIWYILFTTGCYLSSCPNLAIDETPGYRTLFKLSPASITDPKRFIQGLGAVLITWSVANSPTLQKPFLTRFAQYMGKISYAFYIVHGPCIHIVGLSVTPLMWQIVGMNSIARYLLGFALGSAVLGVTVFWAADLFWRGVDCNAVKLSRRVEEWCFVRLDEVEMNGFGNHG